MNTILNFISAIIYLFTCETWIYIAAISLQVSGAICLIMNYWGNVTEKVILTYYTGGGLPKSQDDNTVKLKKERLQSCAQAIYMNRFAFICIIFGYGLGVFGEITEKSSKLYVLFAIILMCAILTSLGYIMSILKSKKAYKEDMDVDREIVKKYTDVQWSDKEEIEYINSFFEKDDSFDVSPQSEDMEATELPAE